MKRLIISSLLVFVFSFGYSQILLNSDIDITSQRSVDGKQYRVQSGKHVPYDNVSQFLSIVPKTRRHIGEICYIYDSTKSGIDIWQFVNGTDSANLENYNVIIYARTPLHLQDSIVSVNGSDTTFKHILIVDEATSSTPGYLTASRFNDFVSTIPEVGTAAPATTPSRVGIWFIDAVNKKVYVSAGTGSSADWIIIN